MWWKRNVVPSSSIESARTSRFAARSASLSGTCGRSDSDTISVTADSGNCSPITEAGSMTARSSRVNWSRRASSNAWIVGRTRIVAARIVVDPPVAVVTQGAALDQHRRASAPQRAGCPRPRDAICLRPHRPTARRHRGDSDDLVRISGCQRLEHDPHRLPPDRPSRRCRVTKSCRAVHNSRMDASRRTIENVFQQVQERRFGPVDVVHDHDQGRSAARVSSNLRAPQNSSGSENWVDVRPIADRRDAF